MKAWLREMSSAARTWLAATWASAGPADRALPPVKADIGPAVPGWALCAAATASLVGALLAVGMTVGLGPVGWGTVALFGGWMAARPGGAPALFATCYAGLVAAFNPALASAWSQWLLVSALAYAAWRLGFWAALARPRARVALAALRGPLARDAAIVLATALLAGVVALSRSAAGLTAGAIASVALAAAGCLAACSYAVVRLARR